MWHHESPNLLRLLKKFTDTDNYRKIYEKATNSKIPKGYVIHHLDFDRTNNNFSNLLMLPEKLHNKYHKVYPLVVDTTLSTNIVHRLEPGYLYNNFTFNKLKKFMKVYIKCCKWKEYKEFQIGNLTNIHNIKL